MVKKQTAKPVPAVEDDDRYGALRERLVQQREELHSMYKEDVKAGQESADVGTEDTVDRANAAYNRELMFSLSDTERQLLFQVEDAIRRLDDKTFGRCANCGNAIGTLRLEAVPWARYCIDCQELAEQGLLHESEAS